MRHLTRFAWLAALAGAALLAGCAGLNNLTSDVASFGTWPAERKPSTYAFERLPSQQAQPDLQRRLENAARPAMADAGFTEAADAQAAEVSVLLGARVSPSDRYPWDDPFWWHGGLVWGRHGYWVGPWWGMHAPSPTYEREVAILIRDRKTGTPLYEARASNDGASPSIESLLPAMFAAAMKDFPAAGPNPRRVVTPITR
jgi:hypothetical protein